MTEKQQRRFYFPAWQRCAFANDWVMRGGRLQADLTEQHQEFSQWDGPAQDVALQVLDYAEQLAAQDHRAVTAEDLRHACSLVATEGREVSSFKLNNHQTNRVVVLFRLLHEPRDLDAVMEWLNPELSDKRSLVSFIRKQAPEATLSAIARNAYHTIFWEDLDSQQLKWLLKQVKGRQQSFREPVKSAPQGEYVAGPF